MPKILEAGQLGATVRRGLSAINDDCPEDKRDIATGTVVMLAAFALGLTFVYDPETADQNGEALLAWLMTPTTPTPNAPGPETVQ